MNANDHTEFYSLLAAYLQYLQIIPTLQAPSKSPPGTDMFKFEMSIMFIPDLLNGS